MELKPTKHIVVNYNFTKLKLDYNNYLFQRHQIEVILEVYFMINFIKDTTGAPNPNFLKHSSENYTIEANKKFIYQGNHEQALFTFINSTLFQSLVSPFRKNAFFFFQSSVTMKVSTFIDLQIIQVLKTTQFYELQTIPLSSSSKEKG